MPDSKTYLNVPYAQKDAAKALGAKWNPAKKKWYAPTDIDITRFAKWQTQSATSESSTTPKKKPQSRPPVKNVVFGITTYGNNKDLTICTGGEPPWD